ncbi:MAG: hypothetical protein K9H12_12135, partial [Bacteroidales bacterium]|nr:hypothetical protein [Bacteroidales bacterium]
MRKILIFLWLAFLSGLCNSQILTLQFGKNHSTIDGINGTEIKGFTEPLIGQNIFIGTDYWNKKFFNLSTNLGYINKKGEDGYWYTSPYGSSYITNKVDITYLTINTYFDLKFPILNTFYPYVSFGPRLDYLVKNENEANMEILTSYAIGLSMGGGLKA